MNEKVQPFIRSGGWVSIYSGYYKWAYVSHGLYQTTITNLVAEEARIRSAHETEISDTHTLESLVLHKTTHLHDLAYMYAISSFIFVCLTIEGFVNNYGTVRLGEAFFKKNIERVSIAEKISILALICFGVTLKKSDPLLIKTRSIFDERNRLVHPKTREYDPDSNLPDAVYVHPSDFGLKQYLKDLEYIIDCFCKLDPTIWMPVRNMCRPRL